MKNLKYIFIKNKTLFIITAIVLVCAIAIAIGVYAQITNRNVMGSKNNEDQKNVNYDELKSNFDEIFTDAINVGETANKDINYDEIVFCAYDVNRDENNYKINAKIPMFKLENDETKKVNTEIAQIFAQKIVDIILNPTKNVTLDMNYVGYVNNNILSLVISFRYKEGSNPQRHIIQTYNYNIETNKLMTIEELLEYKNLEKDEVQKKITSEIKEQNNQMQSISDQGYNVYLRNENDEMYEVENTPSYFIGKDNYLYLVYAYGNNNFTTEKDLVIF